MLLNLHSNDVSISDFMLLIPASSSCLFNILFKILTNGITAEMHAEFVEIIFCDPFQLALEVK